MLISYLYGYKIGCSRIVPLIILSYSITSIRDCTCLLVCMDKFNSIFSELGLLSLCCLDLYCYCVMSDVFGNIIMMVVTLVV